MKKLRYLLLLLLTASLLGGCASNADTLATPTPGATNLTDGLLPGGNTAAPAASSQPGGTETPDDAAAPSANGIQTLEDAQEASEKIEEAVEKLSEVDDAYVVALGDTALVGLQYASPYQGGTDDRIKKMVLSRVQTIDKSITGVAVTDNAALVTGIQALAKALEGASSLDDVNDKAEEMLRQLTVYKE